MSDLEEIKRQFSFLIQRTNYLYLKYKEEPIYLRARCIKETNIEIIKLLMQHTAYFPKKILDDVNVVLDHFQIWLLQFEELEKAINNLTERFVFQQVKQATPYPKKQINNILDKNLNL